MCGIAGFFSRDINTGRHRVLDMLSCIGHRGPDAAGYYVDDDAALGMVRLSILDAVNGHQPMSCSNGRFWISYNGELYNYLEIRDSLVDKGFSFSTRSDTEVVLKAWMCWGPEALPKFNGAFAFAVYDTFARRFFLARDRYGKRPLFYTHHNGDFLFASEMKAFFAWKGFRFDIDPYQVASIYGHWTPLPDQTPFKDVFQLPMASFMVADRDGVRITRYENLDFAPQEQAASLSQGAEQVKAALEESVRLRLRSDVEVGVYLSGGIDSAAVASLARSIRGEAPRTFGVTFEEPALDESPYQEIMARHLGSEHVSLHIGARDIVDALPAAVYHAEMPVFRTAFVPMFLLSGKVRDCGIKTILSGEGADEVFLGYSLFRETVMRRQWEQLTMEERKQQISLLNPDLKHYNPENTALLLGLYQQFSRERMPGLFSHELRFQNGLFARRLIRDTTIDPFASLYRMIADDPAYSSLSDVEKAQWLEFRTLLSGYLLSTQGERMGMAHAVENRCPFLDPNVVRLAGAVNPGFGIGSYNTKAVLRKAFEADLPGEILGRHKHSYRAPDCSAFIAHRPDYLEAVLSEAELRKVGFIQPGFATALVRKVLSASPETISTRENQAFIYLLTSVLLYRQFSLREAAPFSRATDVTGRLTVTHEQRTQAA